MNLSRKEKIHLSLSKRRRRQRKDFTESWSHGGKEGLSKESQDLEMRRQKEHHERSTSSIKSEPVARESRGKKNYEIVEEK